jgi:Tfp pilus assembly protein PilW
MMRGFTLMETVITIAFSVIIMLAIATLYLNFNKLYLYQQTYVATAVSARDVINAIDAAVLPADAVVSSHTFSGVAITTATSSLVLELPSINSSGDIIAGVHDYIGFATTSTDLFERVDPGTGSVRVTSSKRVGALVDSLFFGYGSGSATQASVISATTTTKLVTKDGTVQTTLHGQFYLRNK